MRYASIRDFDISNGEDIGVSLFVQGCHFHCPNCFNQSTWDFNGGKEFTIETMRHIVKLMDRPYIKRFTLLGGEPLAPENIETSKEILRVIKETYPNKQIWLFTGYVMENIPDKSILKYVDVLVDGPYKHELRDLSLAFRGSSNQRVIKKEEFLCI
jgi:anaerobic ribonucleoside-triphosphate reductase activating protein